MTPQTQASEPQWDVMDIAAKHAACSELVSTMSFKQIALRFGATRQAVSGFCFRNKISGVAVVSHGGNLVHWKRLWRTKPPRGTTLKGIVATDQAIPFLDRTPCQCAWPLWNDATAASDRKVCGAATVKTAHGSRSPYCEDHHARAHRRTEPLDLAALKRMR